MDSAGPNPLPLAPTPAKHPVAELLALAAPTVAQQVSYTLMQLIDTWMLSRTGIDAPTAASQSGMVVFSFLSVGVGTLWVVNTLASQAFGRRDYAQCGRHLWQGVWFSLCYALLMLPVLPLSEWLFRVMNQPAELVPLEADYFRISLGFAFLKLLATAFSQFLLAINRPGSVLVASVAGVLTNIASAWLLIFGQPGLGIEAMGVAGAAWAQNAGVTVELLLMVGVVFLGGGAASRRVFHVFDWRPRWRQFRELLLVGLPAGGQFVADVLAWTLFTVGVMAHFGKTVLAANGFVWRLWVVSFMPAIGVGVAVTALVGRYLGMGRPDLARHRTHLAFALNALYMIACGVFFYFGRRMLIGLFTDDLRVIDAGAMMLIFAAAYQFFDALYITYNGALRGAGDTFVPAVVTAGLNWGLTVAGGYLIAEHWPGLGPAGPWTLATVYGVALGVVIYLRFQAGLWMRRVLA